MSGTARTHSYATATAYSAPTSSTAAVTSRWGTLGTTSTSLPSGVRRSGKTRRRATVRRRRTSGGTGTTSTAMLKLPPRSSNRSAGAAQPHRQATPRDRSSCRRAGGGDDRTWDGRQRTMKDSRRKQTRAMTKQKTGTREEWLEARLELLKGREGTDVAVMSWRGGG